MAASTDNFGELEMLLLRSLEAEEVCSRETRPAKHALIALIRTQAQEGPSAGPSGGATVDSVPAAPAAAAPSPAPRQRPGLLSLSDPCLLRVLARLSPDDLLSAAQTCRALRGAASDPAIWRALYAARWQQPPPDGELTLPGGWKAAYQQRDGAEAAAAARRAPGDAPDMFAQMAAARRSEPLAPAAAAAVGPLVGSALAERVAAFRRERGLGGGAAADLATPGEASGASTAAPPCPEGCRFVELSPHVWICEAGGHVHPCGDACGERRVDGASEMLVCSLTGRCFPRLMSEWEEGGGGGGGGEEDGGARDGEDPGGNDWNAATEGMGGRLGRAFFAGYNATDEKELLDRFGIKM